VPYWTSYTRTFIFLSCQKEIHTLSCHYITVFKHPVEYKFNVSYKLDFPQEHPVPITSVHLVFQIYCCIWASMEKKLQFPKKLWSQQIPDCNEWLQVVHIIHYIIILLTLPKSVTFIWIMYCHIFGVVMTNNNGFWIWYDWVYWHFFTITVNYDSSHNELLLSDVCLMNLYQDSLEFKNKLPFITASEPKVPLLLFMNVLFWKHALTDA
jgi:hypothetical protein